MKKILELSLIIGALILCFNVDVSAQYGYGKKKKKKKEKVEENDEYFDESGGFGHKLWYGGGFNLNFSSNNFVSTFQIGVSPMVGYKITPEFSIGPRTAITYINLRVNDGGQVLTSNPLTWSAGAFARYKVFQNFFGHAEFEYQNAVVGYNLLPNDLEPVRQTQNNYFLGAGYNSGSGIVGYEIYLLYNVNLPETVLNQSPIVIRFGLTYNF